MLILGIARFKPGIQAQHEALRSDFSSHMMQPLNPRIRLAGPLLDDNLGPVRVTAAKPVANRRTGTYRRM